MDQVQKTMLPCEKPPHTHQNQAMELEGHLICSSLVPVDMLSWGGFSSLLLPQPRYSGLFLLFLESIFTPRTQPQGNTCRFLFVLEHLLDFLIAADLFHALSLNSALAKLLQELVGTREPFQDRMGILGLQKH